MEELVHRLTARFPLLRRLAVQRSEQHCSPELFPCFYGIFMSVMKTALPTPVCFVLPRRGNAARLGAVLYGLNEFVAAQRDLLKAYGQANFESGDLVRIHPTGHIFRFGGFADRSSDFICLRSVNGPSNERWLVRASEFLPRLERTKLTRPMGRLNSPLHSPAPAALDVLLGTSTFGNQGLFRNEVVLLDSQVGFQSFVDSVRVLPTASIDGTGYPVKGLLPFGELRRPSSQLGWFKRSDERNPTGEPLIALVHSTELLAEFCVAMPSHSRLVVVNGLSRLKDLQAFDDVSATQRLVLFADDRERELVEALVARGCRSWSLTAAECEAGSLTPPRFGGLTGSIRIWARNKYDLTLDSESCTDDALEQAAAHLEGLRALLRDDREDGALTKLTGRAWRLLNDMAAIVRPLSDAERLTGEARLAAFRQEVQREIAWLAPEAASLLADTAEAIHRSLATAGRAKAAALLDVLGQSVATHSAYALVARESQTAELDEWLSRTAAGARCRVQVHTARTLKDEVAFDRLICISWPGSDVMHGLVTHLVAPRITLLGYPFERRWLKQFERRVSQAPCGPELTPREKARLVLDTDDEDAFPSSTQALRDDAATGPIATDDIWQFEQRLRTARKGLAASPTEALEVIPSRYVSFVGASYAFLTETHRIVVATELLSRHSRQAQRLPERLVSELRQGDYIVFPASGERELIQEKADQLLGTDAARLRATARLWKEALWSCGTTPDAFWNHARELRRGRHIATIRKWFADAPQIGPGLSNEDLSEDLELIALVTAHEPLRSQLPQVIAAIKTLRSAHLSAGMRIRDILIQRLPEVMGRIEADGTLIELGELGSAWIIQIDAIAAESEPRGRAEVNRLLREEPSLLMA